MKPKTNGVNKLTDIEEKVRQSLKGASFIHGKIIPSASKRYLHLAENIVRQAVSWQNEEGRIIDPYEKRETNTLTARFVGALGLLILKGRCLDLIEPCTRALTPALEDLFHKKFWWVEFITKEACMAYMALKDKVQTKQAAYWNHLLNDYDPELVYSYTFTNNPHHLKNNVCTFGIAGEAIKKKLGGADNCDFINRYIEQQLTLFDKNGMYNDPHSPMTYDMVARMNLSLALWAGYMDQYYEKLSEILKLGALSQLLYQSPVGECPFGGRSNQQNFNEVTFALICEFEASRWAEQGDPAMAGSYKRAAALAINSIEKYLQTTPIFFTKNLFPPETQHGRQADYGFYGAYSLLIASQLGFAAILADDNIKETKCPAECGGYVFITEKSFHKVFATCAEYHIEIDTNADFKYDATGLGRVHRIGFPAELALSIPINAKPDYLTVIPPAGSNFSISPGWNNVWLSNLSGEKLHSACKVFEESRDRVCFSIDYTYDSYTISEKYDISSNGIEILATQHEGHPLSFRIPLLKTNGADETIIKMLDDGFLVLLDNFAYRVSCLTANTKISIENIDAPNRNGIYKIGCFTGDKNQMHLLLKLEKTM